MESACSSHGMCARSYQFVIDIKLFHLSEGQAIVFIGSAVDQEKSLQSLIAVMTMKVSRGLVFPTVAWRMGHMPGPGTDEKGAVRVFYIAAMRSTQRLVIGAGEWLQTYLMRSN